MERWYWIELIGFDCDAEDYGVEAFLSRNVSTTGVSLLFSHIDFIFYDEETLPPTACSYFAHEYNRERKRQNWSKTQLRGLIAELHRRGVQVFFSCFDMTSTINDPTWLCYGNEGTPRKIVYVIKPALMQTVVERIAAVLETYGFDGLQLADGLSSNRLSIENGDFSLEFCAASGIPIPEKLMKDGIEAYVARKKWILRNARYEWTEYLATAWERFYEHLFNAVRKPILFNNAWTRDPFEALYRYGLDYSRCQTQKAMAVMVEENSASRAIMSAEDEGGVEHMLDYRDKFHYEYALMQQEIRLATNGLKQVSLVPISDTQEQWDALRHCPTELARSIVKRYNNFVYRDGNFEVCCDAPWYCLSDGIPSEDWKWLAKQEGYRIPKPDFIDGFVSVYNRDALRRDVKQFCEKKGYYGFSLLCELAYGGLNFSASVCLDEAIEFDCAKCLLVTDLNCYTYEEKKILSSSKLPVLVIGEDVELPMSKSTEYRGKYISVAVYGDALDIKLPDLCALEKTIARKQTRFGEIWTEPLSHLRISPKFFRAVSVALNEGFNLDRCDDQRVKVNSFLCNGERYILLSSDYHTYCNPTVITDHGFIEAEAIMKECGYKVKSKVNQFSLRIPPRSLEIVRLKN